MPTKDELEAENAELRERIRALEADVSRETSEPKRPERPEQLSAGEADDPRQFGVCISPFDGRTLNVLDFPELEPANDAARKMAERHHRNRDDAQVIVDAQHARSLTATMGSDPAAADVSRETTSGDSADK